MPFTSEQRNSLFNFLIEYAKERPDTTLVIYKKNNPAKFAQTSFNPIPTLEQLQKLPIDGENDLPFDGIKIINKDGVEEAVEFDNNGVVHYVGDTPSRQAHFFCEWLNMIITSPSELKIINAAKLSMWEQTDEVIYLKLENIMQAEVKQANSFSLEASILTGQSYSDERNRKFNTLVQSMNSLTNQMKSRVQELNNKTKQTAPSPTTGYTTEQRDSLFHYLIKQAKEKPETTYVLCKKDDKNPRASMVVASFNSESMQGLKAPTFDALQNLISDDQSNLPFDEIRIIDKDKSEEHIQLKNNGVINYIRNVGTLSEVSLMGEDSPEMKVLNEARLSLFIQIMQVNILGLENFMQDELNQTSSFLEEFSVLTREPSSEKREKEINTLSQAINTHVNLIKTRILELSKQKEQASASNPVTDGTATEVQSKAEKTKEDAKAAAEEQAKKNAAEIRKALEKAVQNRAEQIKNKQTTPKVETQTSKAPEPALKAAAEEQAKKDAAEMRNALEKAVQNRAEQPKDKQTTPEVETHTPKAQEPTKIETQTSKAPESTKAESPTGQELPKDKESKLISPDLTEAEKRTPHLGLIENFVNVMATKSQQFEKQETDAKDPKEKEKYTQAKAALKIVQDKVSELKTSYEDGSIKDTAALKLETKKLFESESINNALKVLDTHRGPKQFIVDFFTAIITLGVSLIHGARTGNYSLFTVNTDTRNVIDEHRKNLENPDESPTFKK